MIVLLGDIGAERHPAKGGFEGFELEGFCDGILLRIECPGRIGIGLLGGSWVN